MIWWFATGETLCLGVTGQRELDDFPLDKLAGDR